MANRPFTSLAAVGSMLVLACACQGGGAVTRGPELSTGGPTNWSMNALPAVGPSNHADIGSMFLCLTGPGRALITDVQPVRPVGNVEVVAFAVRPKTGRNMLGSDTGPLQAYGFNTADRIVDTQCAADSGKGYELGLELSVPPGTNAGTSGFQIDYTVAGQSANLIYPLGAILCSTPNLDDPECKPLFQEFGLATDP